MDDATAASRGPQPATTVARPGIICWALRRIVAAARPIAPGRVQPGIGITRSDVPVAATTALASHARGPSRPTASTRKPGAANQIRWPRAVVTGLAASSARRRSPSGKSSPILALSRMGSSGATAR